MKHVFSIFCVFLFSNICFAWPEFTAPDQAFLMQNHFIDTAHCPKGQGQLLNGVSIPIKGSLCFTYCPKDWFWVTESDHQCHDLQSGFELGRYDIKIHHNNDGTANYSEAKAFYYERMTGAQAFHLSFRTQPGGYWFCTEIDSERHVMSCANDI